MEPETTTGRSRTMWYIIGAVLVILAGLGFWMFGGSVAPGASEDAAPQTQNTSLTNLLASQGSQKCTFSTVTAQSSSSGTVYVANGKMRGDFVSMVDGKTTNSHMIVEGDTSYLWSDAMPQGIKMSFNSMQSGQSTSQEGTVDPNAPTDYSCSSWSEDASMFVLPAGITFQDMSSMMPPGAGAGAGAGAGMTGSSQQCAACDAITDPTAKAQCKVALSCQ